MNVTAQVSDSTVMINKEILNEENLKAVRNTDG
jgi:hypothetical protein